MHTIFIIYGSTGDLAKRKLFPALYNIFKYKKGLEIDIIAVGRRNYNDTEFREFIDKETDEFIGKSDDFSRFLDTINYSKVELTNPTDYANLKQDIKKIQRKTSQIIFYLSIAPEYFDAFVDNYKHINIKKTKIIFEKPFGTDLKSAKKLNTKIMEVFREEQVYRIDHYVGKEAIQNILAFRFANIIFEPIWNNKYIDNIQITASETVGVGDRGGYYDKSGALRDMVQNHLFQVLSLVVMNPPSMIDSDGIRQEKLKVFRSIKLGDNYENNIVFGQYNGYLEEKDIAKNSKTETFVAMKLEVNSWNFVGVPIYLRTGKALEKKLTQIVIEFKEVPDILFKKFGNIEKNRIILEIQPNEGIDIHFNIKENGNSQEVERVKSKFEKELESKEAYEKLLEDAIISDKTLFTSWEMLEQSWKIVDNLVNCKNDCPLIHKYPKGSNGPIASDYLLENDGRKWYESK
ncbi:MAG: glucose-6-phosphate dehydrogenase [Candidatus Gracilibacteria bacterium]|nr:glucose-6-phosphate dehydrogenase [Candidatus Gracilibacteria bacterium]